MSKIIVIGCGQGGLVAAKHLSTYGHDVTVFEAKGREDAAYPWRDDIRRNIFEEAGLNPLPIEDCVQKSKWRFVSPDGQASLRVPMTPPLEEISISRKTLLERLIALCDGVQFKFETPVDSLIIRGDRVAGVRASDTDYPADMVIDASGYLSKFRAQVPKIFGVPEPKEDDCMCAFRAFYQLKTNAELPNPPCTLYVKHLGGAGISWCNLSNDNTADILIGRIGELGDEEIAAAKADLLERHEFANGEPIFERKVKIALRYPAGVMVAHGYAIVGDSAYMTMPFMGSGIESSMKAGRLLADVIGRECDFNAESLYKYQRDFWKMYGNFYTLVDVVKRWALNLPPKDIDWAFNSGLVTDEDMSLLSTDENVGGIGFFDVLKKVGIAFTNFGLILRAVKYVIRGFRALSYAKKMPKRYDCEKLKKWADRLDKKVRG